VGWGLCRLAWARISAGACDGGSRTPAQAIARGAFCQLSGVLSVGRAGRSRRGRSDGFDVDHVCPVRQSGQGGSNKRGKANAGAVPLTPAPPSDGVHSHTPQPNGIVHDKNWLRFPCVSAAIIMMQGAGLGGAQAAQGPVRWSCFSGRLWLVAAAAAAAAAVMAAPTTPIVCPRQARKVQTETAVCAVCVSPAGRGVRPSAMLVSGRSMNRHAGRLTEWPHAHMCGCAQSRTCSPADSTHGPRAHSSPCLPGGSSSRRRSGRWCRRSRTPWAAWYHLWNRMIPDRTSELTEIYLRL
jgi:hypothetical protein